MSSLRSDPLTGDRIILAPDRHRRPNPYGDSDVDPCPFCPGNESLTPPEVMRSLAARGGGALRSAPSGGWQVRAFANKYPAVGDAPDGAGQLQGRHEIVVESPDHDSLFEHLSDDALAEVIAVWLARYSSLAEGGSTVVLFKNSGARAGASIPHIHSQLLALPFVPPRLDHEATVFRRSAACPLCHEGPGAVIAEGEHFRWEADPGARLPYGQRIVPRKHASDFTTMSEEEQAELGTMLREAAAACTSLRRDAAYNWGFHNFAPHHPGHWYVEVTPRLAGLAGFELTTGCYINSVDAASATNELRERRRA